jgi:hypothetical protein
METFVRRCLYFSMALEVLLTFCILADVRGFPSLPWAAMSAGLFAGTFVTTYLVRSFWARMGTLERVSAGVSAVVPLVPVALYVTVIALLIVLGVIAGIALLAAGLWYLSNYGADGAYRAGVGSYRSRKVFVNPYDDSVKNEYGHRIGRVDRRTGEVKNDFGNSLGRLDK